jgi:hypothetical protein
MSEDNTSSFLELQAVIGFLAELASFHLQVADHEPPTAELTPLQDSGYLHKPQARFYEVLKQQLALLAQHLSQLKIEELQNDTLEQLGKISRMICRLISTKVVIEIWGNAGFVGNIFIRACSLHWQQRSILSF